MRSNVVIGIGLLRMGIGGIGVYGTKARDGTHGVPPQATAAKFHESPARFVRL